MKKIKCERYGIPCRGNFLLPIYIKYNEITHLTPNKDSNSKDIYLNTNKTHIFLSFWNNGIGFYKIKSSKLYITKKILKKIIL